MRASLQTGGEGKFGRQCTQLVLGGGPGPHLGDVGSGLVEGTGERVVGHVAEIDPTALHTWGQFSGCGKTRPCHLTDIVPSGKRDHHGGVGYRQGVSLLPGDLDRLVEEEVVEDLIWL